MRKSEHLNDWLRDAHAMEMQAEQLLSTQARKLDRYPQISALLREHVDLTRAQRARLEECLERRQTSHSVIKDTMGKVTAAAQNASGLFIEDEIVKAILAIYTFEQMAVASYAILEAAAKAEGDAVTARQCALSRAEEQNLCRRLFENMGQVAVSYLREQETA